MPVFTPVPPEVVQRAIALYGTGMSILDVANEVGSTYSLIRRELRAAGVRLRKSSYRPGQEIPVADPDPVPVRHFCGRTHRHIPHVGCNGFGFAAGPPSALCTREEHHLPHRSCDGKGAVACEKG